MESQEIYFTDKNKMNKNSRNCYTIQLQFTDG